VNATIFIPILGVLIAIVVAAVSGYYGAQIGVRVALAQTEMRLNFMEREMTSVGGDIAKFNREMVLFKYDWWSIDADVDRVCKANNIDRVQRRHADDSQYTR
jgi:hypothetical protein